MNTLRIVDYKLQREITIEFSIFAEAKQAALDFSKFVNPDGLTKRIPAVDGVIDHGNMYSDLYEEVGIMLNVPKTKLLPKEDRWARLFGLADEDEIDYIEKTVEMCPHIEWDDKSKGTYFIYITKKQYEIQMSMPDRGWCDPTTGLGDGFDDEYFEKQHLNK